MPKPSDGSAAIEADDMILIDGLNASAWGQPAIFESLRAGGLTAVNATIASEENFAQTAEIFSQWLGYFDRFSTLIRPVRTVEDIHAAKREKRTGIILGWQNTAPIELDIQRFRFFHSLGLRVVQLTYNQANVIGDGCFEVRDAGLSLFGRDVVRELNRLGIVIDLSHVGDRAVLETIDLSEVPVAITHANARSQYPGPRNKSDEAIRRLAQRGGVIGANALPLFFPKGYDTTIGEYLDAIDRLVEIAGIDHVAIGSDLCEGQSLEWWAPIFESWGNSRPDVAPFIPFPYRHLHGFEGAAQFPAISQGLAERGYQPEDIAKIAGGNWLRLFSSVWKA